MVNYVIHDGARVGLFDEYVLHNQANANALGALQEDLRSQNKTAGTLSTQLWDYCAYVVFDNQIGRRPNISGWVGSAGTDVQYPSVDEAPKECLLIESISNCKRLKAPGLKPLGDNFAFWTRTDNLCFPDTFDYLANGVRDSTSTFKNTLLNQTYDLTGLTLNISTYFLPAIYAHPSRFEEKFDAYENDTWAGDPKNARYTLNSVNGTQIFDIQQILDNGVCQPQKEYNWGFSGLLLFWTVLMTTIWGIGMWTMYLDALFHSQLVKHGRSMGRYRAAVDFVDVMQQNLGPLGSTESLSDADLRHRLKQAVVHSTIDYVGVKAEKKAATLTDRTGRLRVAPVLSIEYWLHSKGLGPYDID